MKMKIVKKLKTKLLMWLLKDTKFFIGCDSNKNLSVEAILPNGNWKVLKKEPEVVKE